jgi:hypothetical protein
MTIQQTFVRYTTYGRDIKHFSANSIFTSFSAFRMITTRNINWLRADLSSVGLFLINISILTSPCLLSIVAQSFGGCTHMVPKIVVSILRNFVTLNRGQEVYEHVNGLDSFEAVRNHLNTVRTQVFDLIKGKKLEMFGYQVPGLSDTQCYDAQLKRILHVLDVYLTKTTPHELINEIVVNLGALRDFPGVDLSFVRFSDLSDVSFKCSANMPYGARKYVRIGENYVAFQGDASEVALCVSMLFISRIESQLGSGLTYPINGPMIGSSVILVDVQTDAMWLVSLFNSFAVAMPEEVTSISSEHNISNKSKPSASSPLVLQTYQGAKPPSRGRRYHTSATVNQGVSYDQRQAIYLFRDNKLELLGYLVAQ